MRSHCASFLVFSFCVLATPAMALDLGGTVGGAVGGIGGAVGKAGGAVGGAVGKAGGAVGGAVGKAGGAVGGAVGEAGGAVGEAGGASGAAGGVGSAGGAESGGVASGSGTDVDGSVGGGVSAGGGLSGAGSVDTNNSSNSGTVSESPAVGAKKAASRVRPLRSARQAVTLPSLLRPERGERALRHVAGFGITSLRVKAGVPASLVRTCWSAIASAARPLGAIRVEAASAGMPRNVGNQVSAPLDVKIQYAGPGGFETRQAKVSCRLGADGTVTAIR